MLPTDYALVEDESESPLVVHPFSNQLSMMLLRHYLLPRFLEFRPYVEMYADDRDKFFEDFSAVFAKLIELGVDRSKKVSLKNKLLQLVTALGPPGLTLFATRLL